MYYATLSCETQDLKALVEVELAACNAEEAKSIKTQNHHKSKSSYRE
jgi:hypothetical protein